MSLAYSPDPAAITALATLTLSARVRAIVNTFQSDPETKLTHTDFSVISRLLALLSPKPDADPSPDYLEAETAALFIFETRGRSFRRLMEADPSTPISTLMYRIISKSLRLISKRIKREERQAREQTLKSLAIRSARAGGPAQGGVSRPADGNAAAAGPNRGLEVSNAPTPSLADVLSDLDELTLLAADTDSQQLPKPAPHLPPRLPMNRKQRRAG
jgi:hypothetical protein